jgi:hypothetical protein
VGLNDRTVAPEGSGEIRGFSITPGVTGVILIGAGCDTTLDVPAAISAGATDSRVVSVPCVLIGLAPAPGTCASFKLSDILVSPYPRTTERRPLSFGDCFGLAPGWSIGVIPA